MLRAPRPGALKWVKLLGALFLALWLTLLAVPGRAQLDDPPPPDSAIQIQDLRDKLRDDPYDAEAHTKLAILLAKEGLLEESRTEFIQALQAAPSEPASHLNLGLILMRMERWLEASSTLATYTLMTQAEARGHILVGECLDNAGETEKAREAWQQGLAVEGMVPADRTVLVERLATSYLDSEELEAATQLIESNSTLLQGEDGEVLGEQLMYASLTLAKQAKDAGNVDEALARYARARELGTDSSSAFSQPVELLLDAGRVEEAQALAAESKTAFPKSAAGPYLSGRIAERDGNMEEAVKQYQAAAAIDPDFAGLQAALGGALAQTGNADAATAALEQAVARGEGGAAVRYNMGVMLSKDNKFGEAIPHLQAAVADDPTLKDAYRALGTAYRKTDNFGDAASTYQEIVKRFGPDARDLYQLGFALAKKGDHAEAVEQYRVVVALDGQNYAARYNLGNSLMKLSRFAEASTEFKQAVALKPGSEVARYNLALSLQKQEKFEEAINEYERAVELKETYRSFVNLAICYQALDDQETSDEYYRLANELKSGGR